MYNFVNRYLNYQYINVHLIFLHNLFHLCYHLRMDLLYLHMQCVMLHSIIIFKLLHDYENRLWPVISKHGISWDWPYGVCFFLGWVMSGVGWYQVA